MHFRRSKVMKWKSLKSEYNNIVREEPEYVGWLIHSILIQFDNGFIDEGSLRTAFRGGHPSKY